VWVGSAALGLMVWRDLDLTVICGTLDAEPVAATGARLATHQRVREVRFRNDTGPWNVDPIYPDGLYLGLQCRSAVGEEWKVDIWFVDEPERQPDLAHVRDLPPRLNNQTRAAILWVKSVWAGRPEYRRQVTSWDIYTAVLDHGCAPRPSSPAGCGAPSRRRAEQDDVSHVGPDAGLPMPLGQAGPPPACCSASSRAFTDLDRDLDDGPPKPRDSARSRYEAEMTTPPACMDVA
jgi:hypothetical protein